MRLRQHLRLSSTAAQLVAAVVLVLLSGRALAKENGDVVAMQPIVGFAGLVEYIRITEGRDAPELAVERYHALDSVEFFGITYWSDGLRVKGFLLKPRRADRLPAIIYNRGGSLEWGSLTHHVASVQLGELAHLKIG